MPNGFMTLRQALAEARGIPYTGNKSYIQVIRGNILRPQIYTLTWDHVIHLPNDSCSFQQLTLDLLRNEKKLIQKKSLKISNSKWPNFLKNSALRISSK